MNEHRVEGWRMPVVPAGYDTLIACHYPDRGEYELDFFNETTQEFASESSGALPNIPWPWKPGHTPQPADWRRLGIPVMQLSTAS